MFIKQLSAIFKIDHIDFSIATQVTFAIEAICGWRLPIFHFFWGVSPRFLKFQKYLDRAGNLNLYMFFFVFFKFFSYIYIYRLYSTFGIFQPQIKCVKSFDEMKSIMIFFTGINL